MIRRRASRWTWSLVLAAGIGAAACSGGTPGAPAPSDGPTATAAPDADAAQRETVEVDLWVAPDRTEGLVRFVIDDPLPTGSSSIQLSGDILRTATERTVLVDGQPREFAGSGQSLIPWTFGTDRVLEVELRFPLVPATRWLLAGDMLDEWLPIRVTVPRYFSRVTWDVEVHAPVEARFGGDPHECRRPAPQGLDAAFCTARDEIGLPPLVYLPAEGEPVRTSADGYVEVIGDLPAATAEDVLAFADDAVRRLNQILGDIAPRRVEVVIGDVVGNFAGEASGPMVVLDGAYVRSRPDDTRDLLAHELVHTAQEHRLVAPGRDPGSGMTESLAEYLGARLRYGDDLESLRAYVRGRGVGDAQVSDVEGISPRDAFGRRPPIGQDQLLATYEYERRALVYTYLPRAWVDLQAFLGVERMDAFLRDMHTRPDLDWNIDQIFTLADGYDPEAGAILRGYWEDPVAADQEQW